MNTAEEYRRTAWDCLKLAEATLDPRTRASMLDLAQVWVGLADRAARNNQYRLAGYRAKAWACEARARHAKNPRQREDLQIFAQLWMSLTEPLPYDLRGAYELPRPTAQHH